MRIKRVIRELYIKIRSLYIRAYRIIYKSDDNMVLFTSFGGTSYSDNPRAVSEALAKLDPDINIVWILSGNSEIAKYPSYINVVKKNHHILVWTAMAKARVIVTNENCNYIPKGKKQCFITTWHGDRAFKKILLDVGPAPRSFVPESIPGYCDYATAGSDYGVMQYQSAFLYNGKIIRQGCPRNDVLVNPDFKREELTRKRLGIPEGSKVLLYAPTLRKSAINSSEGQKLQDIDLAKLAKILENKTGNQWYVLLRAHPVVASLNIQTDEEPYIDATNYEDMADLLAISDFLITDYSSCAGDFALTGRPILLYQSDIDDYVKNDRKLYFKMEDSPYYVAKTQSEAEKIVKEITSESAKKNCEEILRFYNTFESGKASDTLAEIIIKRIKSV